jgi:hypothetical protein
MHSSTLTHYDLSEDDYNSNEESDYSSGHGSDESDDEYDSDYRSEDEEYTPQEYHGLDSTGNSADHKSDHSTGRHNFRKKSQHLFENLLKDYPGKEHLTSTDFGSFV